MNFPVVSGGFALLATTGATLALLNGLGGLPMITAGTLGLLGEKLFWKFSATFNLTFRRLSWLPLII